MDVSKRNSVQALCDSVTKDLPPIGSVGDGALVLKDQLFVKMESHQDALSDVFAPKVKGTIHPDDMFPEPTLDFFILFLSMSHAIRDAGQENYNVASTPSSHPLLRKDINEASLLLSYPLAWWPM
ncbi:hypothetical protein CEP54_016189 [Fusarium duplospermum]|uniref:Ketoreductase (KR) domain-containing protein n=1 Tax=Fusarium duplospermum TaxID=1325734 RepID=A0A428NH56_9HYPO|nr:hypothetical protein CEP54_016189 [Fusarium duplospermum]